VSKYNHQYVSELFRTLQTENAERNSDYDTSRKRVDGVLWGDSTNPTPRNRYSLSANYLQPIVMKHVQLLVGRLPALQVMPRGAEQEDREHAEKLEGVLYGIWNASNAGDVFQKAAWDSYVLRRGLVYYWWDLKAKQARFKHINPDDFYPEWDGDEVYQCVYGYRRNVKALQDEYPDKAAGIEADPATWTAQIYGQDQPRMNQTDYVTVIDFYHRDGHWTRIVNDLVLEDMQLAYPENGVPFVEFPCYPSNGNREPKNGIDQLVELVQYLSQLVSQKADVIRTYANPTILGRASGQSPEQIRRAVAADGSVLPVHRDGNLEFLNWQGTMPAIEEQVELIRDLIFDLSGKPRSAFGQTVTNQSGVVTNLALTPTLQSNEYHETQWGKALSFLNRRLLQLTEKFGKSFETTYRGYRPVGADLETLKVENLSFKGEDIQGWYENRIKWPSAIRTDDPVYIQNILSLLTSDPPAISLYTALEMFGKEDVEAEIDRIEQQLQDPRMHPDRLAAGQEAANAAGNGALAGQLLGAGGGPPPAAPPPDAAASPEALEATGNPNRDALS
jgi:hypothetical protein